MPCVLRMCTGAGEVQTLGDNAQTLEDEASADVADTLIDNALGNLLQHVLHCICPDVTILQNVGLACKVHVLHKYEPKVTFVQAAHGVSLSLTQQLDMYICIYIVTYFRLVHYPCSEGAMFRRYA